MADERSLCLRPTKSPLTKERARRPAEAGLTHLSRLLLQRLQIRIRRLTGEAAERHDVGLSVTAQTVAAVPS